MQEGAWYGWPDFSANFTPLTAAIHQPPGEMLAPAFKNGQRLPDKLTFLIDHQASGLKQPDKKWIAGLHPINSSPSKLDVAPAAWGDYGNDLFIAEWGDLAWFNNAARDEPTGNKIVMIDQATGRMRPFIQNAKPGPASEQGFAGQGLERPFDVRFGPDGAMYIVDYGQMNIVMNRVADGRLPFEWVPKTGIVWKVSRK